MSVGDESEATIVRFRFTDWRGITVMEDRIGPGGVLVEATNGKGKTSFVTGLRAALSGKGVDAAAVRVGAEQAELLIDLRHATVRRVLKANGGGGLKITRADGTDQPRPQEWLNELFGISPLDPIDLFEEKDPKKRRAKILSAMPITVSPEVLAPWLPPGEKITAAECEGHGLDVVERLRTAYYERRTEAGRVLKAASLAASTATARAVSAENEVGPGDVREAQVVDNDLNVAIREQHRLETQAEQATKQGTQNERTRAKIKDLRAQAEAYRKDASELAPDQAHIAEIQESRGVLAEEAKSWDAKILELQEQIATMTAERDTTLAAIFEIDAALKRVEQDEAKAEDLVAKAVDAGSRAEELEATIASSEPPDEAAQEAARARVAALRQELERAGKAANAAKLRAAAEVAKAEEAKAKAAHAALDAAEKALKHDAPPALLAASNGVPGLTIEGETIRMDGVALETLSGAEQLWFAVDIAKRLNAKSKLLVIDRLEAVAPDQLEDFLEHAREGGFQLIATRVAEGDLRATPIGGAP